MLSKEQISISTGTVLIVLITGTLNLLLNINMITSILSGIILGILISALVTKPTIKIILGIIAWGLISFAILAAILKQAGLINSPPITELLLGGMLIELLRIETKFKEFGVKLSMLWQDFRKRKNI